MTQIGWFSLLACALLGNLACAEDKLTLIPMESLPLPAADVADLLDRADVSFRYGPRRLLDRHLENPTPDPPFWPAAETRFQLNYQYRFHTQWQIDHDRKLTIDVRHDKLELDVTHDVWLKEEPSIRAFWDDRLVRHELDHIRISSHPAVAKRFAEKVRSARTLVRRIDDGVTITDEMVNEIVERHVRDIFNQTIDLVRIRYRELDRLTDHGLRPIPAGAKVRQWTTRQE